MKSNHQHELTSSVRLIALWTTSTSVDCVATHRVRSVDAVELEVQAARVAHHLAAQVATPDRRRCRSAIGARQVLLRTLLIIVGILRAVVVIVVAFW